MDGDLIGMNAFEKALYKKAREKGIYGLEIYPNKVIYRYVGEYVKITKMNPSAEFVSALKELV